MNVLSVRKDIAAAETAYISKTVEKNGVLKVTDLTNNKTATYSCENYVLTSAGYANAIFAVADTPSKICILRTSDEWQVINNTAATVNLEFVFDIN